MEALDPVISPDVTAARVAMQSAESARDRLRAVLPRLQARYQEVAEAEYLTRWPSQCQVIEAERDELAAELHELPYGIALGESIRSSELHKPQNLQKPQRTSRRGDRSGAA
jgi:hypothetical protein